jgi:exopolysaccharide biosynthesis polyprenyl glycosylphosphotransferase
VFRRQHRKARPLFVFADIVLIWVAFEAAYATRTHLDLERLFFLAPSSKALLTVSAVLSWALAGWWLGIYDSILRSRGRFVVLAALRQTGWASAAFVLLQYIQRPSEYALSRSFIAFVVLYGFLLLVGFRLAVKTLAPRILDADSTRRHVYVAGTGETALRVARIIEDSEPFGLCLCGFFGDSGGKVRLEREYEVKPLARLPEVLRQQVVDEIVFVVDTKRLAELEETFLLCEEEGVRTRIHVEFFPHVHSRVDLDLLEGEPMLTFAGAPHDEVRLLVKRATDVAAALTALLVLSPLLLLIVVLIRLTSPGPAIFRQERCGLNGRRFLLYKFRTMVIDAEARKAELEHLNVKRTAFKIPNDPRLTTVGKWLRRFSLDELPQLWNIVRGEMTIVGPRPPVPEEVALYERWQRRRLRMRPGLTCLWTLEGRDTLDFDDWMRLDLKYIDEWSLGLDWSIILRTIPQVVLGKGAH